METKAMRKKREKREKKDKARQSQINREIRQTQRKLKLQNEVQKLRKSQVAKQEKAAHAMTQKGMNSIMEGERDPVAAYDEEIGGREKVLEMIRRSSTGGF
jgi:hypothetical protein